MHKFRSSSHRACFPAPPSSHLIFPGAAHGGGNEKNKGEKDGLSARTCLCTAARAAVVVVVVVVVAAAAVVVVVKPEWARGVVVKGERVRIFGVWLVLEGPSRQTYAGSFFGFDGHVVGLR